MLPLIISLVTISVEGTPDVTIFVDPPVIADEALQAPSTFDVRINISTTEPVYSWQFNLSWDPSVLTVIGYQLGDFLNAGNPTNTTDIISGDPVAGWILWSETAIGADFPGKTGSGWLGNVTFTVEDYGYSVLDIDQELTYVMIKNHFPPPPVYQIDPVRENGQFRNVIPGDIGGDTPGTPPDGDVDRYDFGFFAGAYGTSVGHPNFDPLADLTGDTAGSLPDGDVDRYDFGVFAGNYGRPI
jgi:hypothetical protein